MEIRRIPGINPDDMQAVDQAFDGIEAQPIGCCNWPEQYPYTPKVSFRIFHTGDLLWLRFDVEERYTAARVTEDNGQVWTDSCVEFFLELDDRGYYNFETTCPGPVPPGSRRPLPAPAPAAPGVLPWGRPTPPLPAEPFAEREGDTRWSVTLATPPQALFRHDLKTWNGLEARMNLYKCGDNLSHPHSLSWRPIATEKPDFHRPEFFERVKFQDIL